MKFGKSEVVSKKEEKSIYMSRDDHWSINLPIGWFDPSIEVDQIIWNQIKEKFNQLDQSEKSMNLVIGRVNLEQKNNLLYLVARGFFNREYTVYCLSFSELKRFVDSVVDAHSDYTNFEFLKNRSLLIIRDIESPNASNEADWYLMMSLISGRIYWEKSTVLDFCDEKDFFTKHGKPGLYFPKFDFIK